MADALTMINVDLIGLAAAIALGVGLVDNGRWCHLLTAIAGATVMAAFAILIQR